MAETMRLFIWAALDELLITNKTIGCVSHIQKAYLATTIAVTVPNNYITVNILKPIVKIIYATSCQHNAECLLVPKA